MKLHRNHLKINLEKCLIRDQEVSYLGFTPAPQAIKPRRAKLKAIKTSEPPHNVKSIHSFVGLCNFFRNHIQNFAITTAPLFQLTRQDSGYISVPLPRSAYEAFQTLRKQLGYEPTLAFLRAEQTYLLITNAFTLIATLPGGLCSTLAQKEGHTSFHTHPGNSRRTKKLLTLFT